MHWRGRPSSPRAVPGCGFVFPDRPRLVRAEFRRNLPFARSVARSAKDPDDPKSVLGIKTKPFYIDSADPYKRGIPGAQLSFDKSYGGPQKVAVLAKRSLGKVKVKYRIDGGRVRTARTHEWGGGQRLLPRRRLLPPAPGQGARGPCGRLREGLVQGGRKRSKSFTYDVVSNTDNRVLVVAAEDYTGASPDQTPGPHYLDYYLDALEANGVEADVYDIDAEGRVAPDQLGVLSHYDAVIWYTGDDVVTRTAGREPGNADRLALDQMLEFRAYLNEGGRVLYTGNAAGEQYTANVGDQLYDPKGRHRVRAPACARRSAAVPAAAWLG